MFNFEAEFELRLMVNLDTLHTAYYSLPGFFYCIFFDI